MQEATTLPSSPEILAQIVALHGEIIQAARVSLDKAIIIGGLLNQEKTRVGHGNWLAWLKANVPFTERTARNYIRLHENRGSLKSETVSDLSDAYRLLAEPKAVSALSSTASKNLLDMPLTLEEVKPLVTDDDDIIISLCISRCFCLGPRFKNLEPVPVTIRGILTLRAILKARSESKMTTPGGPR